MTLKNTRRSDRKRQLIFFRRSGVWTLFTTKAKLQPAMAEGGASSHSRLQRCMRRARGLQQRLQLQMEVKAGEQPAEQQEEEQQLQEQPSEKPIPLRVLLTDHSPATQAQQAPPPSTCIVKPLPSQSSMVSDSTPSASAAETSPAETRKHKPHCLRLGKPLHISRSLPTLCLDPSTEDLAPPPLSEEAEYSPTLTEALPDSTPGKASLPDGSHSSRSSSPASTTHRSHLFYEEGPHQSTHPKKSTTTSSPTSGLAPPTHPVRNWSCLKLDQCEVEDFPNHSFGSDAFSGSAPITQPASSPPSRYYRAPLPVERWAENVNRYYGSQNPVGGGGEAAECGEELSELEMLYQASLQAPSMHRDCRRISPQPGSSRPGVRSMPPSNGRSKTPTAEIERFAYRSQASPVQKPPAGEDLGYSAENLRRLARSLSGSVSRPGPQNPSHCYTPSLPRPPLTHSNSSFLPRQPHPSSRHLPSSHSFTADHLPHSLQHHGTQAPALPPQHPQPLTSRPPFSQELSGRFQQVLVLPDRYQALPTQNLHAVPMNYGTLPRAPHRYTLQSSTSSLPRTRSAVPPAPQSVYATLARPRRPNTFSSNSLQRQSSLPGSVCGDSGSTPSSVRLSANGPAQPRRLDVPPESDWRQHQPYQRIPRGPPKAPQLCTLCRSLPAEAPHPHCPPCGAYLARLHFTRR